MSADRFRGARKNVIISPEQQHIIGKTKQFLKDIKINTSLIDTPQYFIILI